MVGFHVFGNEVQINLHLGLIKVDKMYKQAGTPVLSSHGSPRTKLNKWLPIIKMGHIASFNFEQEGKVIPNIIRH